MGREGKAIGMDIDMLDPYTCEACFLFALGQSPRYSTGDKSHNLHLLYRKLGKILIPISLSI